MNEQADERESYPWAGPALFIITLIALAAFFIWFVQA